MVMIIDKPIPQNEGMAGAVVVYVKFDLFKR
jgi:hypothetical protein